ncbi:hypothetical protein VNO77_00134 [Canavalia gladiata]|uniref:Uncharacterized protein n=1 Tax=Canavalia gladiata TaxID=3824 RepID=A0AAN9MTD0_CANGL
MEFGQFPEEIFSEKFHLFHIAIITFYDFWDNQYDSVWMRAELLSSVIILKGPIRAKARLQRKRTKARCDCFILHVRAFRTSDLLRPLNQVLTLF